MIDRRPLPAPMPKPRFSRENTFHRALRQRVDAYFEETGLPRRDLPGMYRKTAILFACWGACYGLLMAGILPGWGVALAAVGLGLASAGIGMAVSHDAGHGAFSERRGINRLFYFALDFIGGASYFWTLKHNQLHHTYANVEGLDDDLNVGILARLAPTQPHLLLHRVQHLYMWPLYGLLAMKWQLVDDWRFWIQGHISGHAVKRPRGWDAVGLVGGKLAFYTLAFFAPIALWGPAAALSVYVLAVFVKGLTLALVFQLAHCVEEAAFPLPDEETGRIEDDWAAHQVRTTVDFAPNNRLLSWYVGGLNFQIEHHLFPRISHLHYPALAPIVAETCAECGIPYRVLPTFRDGIRSHYRHLRRLGQEEAALAPEPRLGEGAHPPQPLDHAAAKGARTSLA